MATTNNTESFLTIDQAFNAALEKLKTEMNEKDKLKIHIWRSRYKGDKLSHKKVSDILAMAGFTKIVEEKWMALDQPKTEEAKEDFLQEDEPFKD